MRNTFSSIKTKEGKQAFENSLVKAGKKIYSTAQRVGRDTIRREVLRARAGKRRKYNEFGLYVNPSRMTNF